MSSTQLPGCTKQDSETCNNNQLSLIYNKCQMVLLRKNHFLIWKHTLYPLCVPFCEDSTCHQALTWISSGCFQTRSGAANRCTSIDLSVSVSPARDCWPARRDSPAATSVPTLNLQNKNDRGDEDRLGPRRCCGKAPLGVAQTQSEHLDGAGVSDTFKYREAKRKQEGKGSYN